MAAARRVARIAGLVLLAMCALARPGARGEEETSGKAPMLWFRKLPGYSAGVERRYDAGVLFRAARARGSDAWTGLRWGAGGLLERKSKLGLEFVLLPAGKYAMGAGKGEEGATPAEFPRHEVTVDAFWLCRTECTWLAWEQGGGKSTRTRPGTAVLPATVSWDAATKWCGTHGLRLPSESEWEYGCRAGNDGVWCFGDDVEKLPEYARFGSATPDPVARRKPNVFGLHDMHGNLSEWCQDGTNLYPGAPTNGRGGSLQTDPDLRMMRGGDFLRGAANTRSAARSCRNRTTRSVVTGFRPAVSLDR